MASSEIIAGRDPPDTENTPLLGSGTVRSTSTTGRGSISRAIITDPPYNRGLLTPPRQTSPPNARQEGIVGNRTTSRPAGLFSYLLTPWRGLVSVCGGGSPDRADSPQHHNRHSNYQHPSEKASTFTYLRNFCCPCLPTSDTSSDRRRRRRRERAAAILYRPESSGSDSTFAEYIPSRNQSPLRGGTESALLSPSLAFSPDYSPYSPLIPLPDGQDYFSSPHHHHMHMHRAGGGGFFSRDLEAELRPGYTSHFLPGSYTRTNTQPNTPAPAPSGERRNISFAVTPPHIGSHRTIVPGILGGLSPAGGFGGLTAYGHGYDVARQRMVYRQILAMEEQNVRLGTAEREIGYEGDYEEEGDTNTTASNSGWASEDVSGRTSPYDERHPLRVPLGQRQISADGVGWWALPGQRGRERFNPGAAGGSNVGTPSGGAGGAGAGSYMNRYLRDHDDAQSSSTPWFANGEDQRFDPDSADQYGGNSLGSMGNFAETGGRQVVRRSRLEREEAAAAEKREEEEEGGEVQQVESPIPEQTFQGGIPAGWRIDREAVAGGGNPEEGTSGSIATQLMLYGSNDNTPRPGGGAAGGA
ncbi:hypothetical protein DFH27DRAFT_609004 [Peziza echinospora]|nr:hypothetical protein DFH27DRAFT_609004 [Peziza echinospora]